MTKIDTTKWKPVLVTGIVHISDGVNIDTPSLIDGIADVGGLPGLRVFSIGGHGTHIAVQLCYPNDLEVTTDLVVVLYGRFSIDEPWEKMTNLANKQEVTIVTNADTDDGTHKRTIFDNKKYAWLVFGHKQFAFGIHTALDGTVGDKLLAFVEAKAFGVAGW